LYFYYYREVKPRKGNFQNLHHKTNLGVISEKIELSPPRKAGRLNIIMEVIENRQIDLRGR
jgi:hypothetical protein